MNASHSLLVIRPPHGGGLNITTRDLAFLRPNKYLHDALIDLGLEYVSATLPITFAEGISICRLCLSDIRTDTPTLAAQIHVFNTFFYTKLAALPWVLLPILGGRLTSHDAPSVETSYQDVRDWTSNVDIFSKKYLIFPIHEE
jgi:Ulp1 family protease